MIASEKTVCQSHFTPALLAFLDGRSYVREVYMVSRHRRFSMLFRLLPIFGACNVASVAAAQAYPTKPVRFVVAASPGGSDTFHARLLAERYSELLGQQFVVDNRPGAGGLIGQSIVVNAPPDGHTILLTGRSITAAPFLNANMKFDPQRALAPAALFANYSLVLMVNPKVAATSVSEYVALARARPRGINHAETTGGLMPYVASTIFRAMTKVELTTVAYKDFSQIIVDLTAGRVDSYFSAIAAGLPHITAGRLRALGVTGVKRAQVLPDVPTIAESGVPGYEAASWLFIATPAGTPRTVIERLNSTTARILAIPDVREKLIKAGSEPATSTPEELAKRIVDATEQFARITKELGIKPQ